jgi:hypothetical protein
MAAVAEEVEVEVEVEVEEAYPSAAFFVVSSFRSNL